MNANPLAISSRHLTRHFGAVKALEDLDLEVPRGGVSAFLGPNGSGKTTTIRLLLGLLKPTRGTCELLGRPAGDLDSLSRIGAVVENPSIYPHLTGRENLEITRLMRACPRHRVDEVLELVDLKEAANRLTQGYSLGMKQRLSLALALLHDPELLILDEPTNGLDPAGIREMRQLIQALPTRTGATVFLSTHLLAEAEQVADHLVILAQGRMRFQGSPTELKARTASRLEVLSSAPEQALDCLVALGFSAERIGDRILLNAVPSQTPMIAERLVGAGIPIHGLTHREAHFEDLFLSLTEAS